MSWRWIVLLGLLFNSALFFNGCDKKTTYFSVGLLAPCAELEFQSNALTSAKLKSVSPTCCGINAAATLLLFTLALRWRRVSGVLASRPFFGVLLVTIVLFNSFLVVPTVWEYGVWSPTLRIYAAMDWAVSAGDDADKVLVIIASRAHFVICLLIGYSSIRLGQMLCQRYVFITPDRWWQFKLRGLLTMMVVLGAGIGLLIRLILN